MGIFGPPDVKKLAAKGDVPGLIKSLGYRKDFSVRSSAAEALGKLGDTRAVKSLVALEKDNNAKVSLKASEALDKIGWRP